MSIKSDRWIASKCMGIDAPMIEPFEPDQVRTIRRAPTGEELMVFNEYGRHPTSGKLVKSSGGDYVEEKIISYGNTSYGYDIRVADEFKIFTNVNNAIVDPKNFAPGSFVDFKGPKCVIPPNSFALGRSVEYLRMPREALAICLGKSTYARCGIIVNVTPMEPEWEGHITLEFSNTTPLPAIIYANEGCAQLCFFVASELDICRTSYRDRGGKYMGQTGVTLPRT